LRLFLLVLLGNLALTGPAFGQPNSDPKQLPRIIVMTPLGVAVGSTTKLTLRGLRLDRTAEVKCDGPGIVIKVLNKAKVGVPNQQDANKFGDTQVEVEVKIAADFKGNTAQCVVKTPQGDSPPHRLLIDSTPVLAEREPNNSFRQAQPLGLSQTVEGRIGQPMDVDVFRIEGKQGQQLILEIHAARHGSPLDSLLTLYSGTGQVIATNDDIEGSSDSRLEVTLPKTGPYYVSVCDANDQGGPTHIYRLNVRPK
jgi:Bacterial pre-peptidase C-terminal domain